jgi:hypothetical protein
MNEERLRTEQPEQALSGCAHAPMISYSKSEDDELMRRPVCRRCGRRIVESGDRWVLASEGLAT